MGQTGEEVDDGKTVIGGVTRSALGPVSPGQGGSDQNSDLCRLELCEIIEQKAARPWQEAPQLMPEMRILCKAELRQVDRQERSTSVYTYRVGLADKMLERE